MSGPLAPTPTQRLLLQAVALDGDPAHEAWERWRRTADIDRLDYGSSRLLPYLYRRLEERGVSDPEMDRLKGTYRYAWSANGVLFGHAARALGALTGGGVPTVVLEGAALLTRYYRDQGARLADGFGVMVPWDRRHDAARLLAAQGWTTPEGWDAPETVAGASHARLQGSGGPVDLCWDPFPEACAPAVRERCWEAAEPLEVGGVASRSLAAADELLQICIRASRRDLLPPFRRLCDASVVLRRAGAGLDWSRLVDLARRARVVLPVLASLRLLREILHGPIPDDVYRDLGRARVSAAERVEHRVMQRPRPRLGRLPELVFRHARLAAAGDAAGGLSGLSRYLGAAWGVGGGGSVPLAAVRRALRRLAAPAR